jgi:hypothetical protein
MLSLNAWFKCLTHRADLSDTTRAVLARLRLVKRHPRHFSRPEASCTWSRLLGLLITNSRLRLLNTRDQFFALPVYRLLACSLARQSLSLSLSLLTQSLSLSRAHCPFCLEPRGPRPSRAVQARTALALVAVRSLSVARSSAVRQENRQTARQTSASAFSGWRLAA